VSVKATVFIPVFNGEDFIGELLRSVIAQRNASYKIVVLDNASTDGTQRVVEHFQSQATIEYVKHGRNRGATANFNTCFDLVKTPYFTWISHDDVFYSRDALAIATSCLETHASIKAVHSDMYFIDKRGAAIAKKRFGCANCATINRINEKLVQCAGAYQKQCCGSVALKPKIREQLGFRIRDRFGRAHFSCTRTTYGDTVSSFKQHRMAGRRT
jgi:glycosyltransferase involved in cell wall biosynthesis